MTSMTISLSRGVGSLRFNKSSVGGQAAIEFILFAVMLIIAFAFLIMTYLDNGGFRGGRDSPDVELTQTASFVQRQTLGMSDIEPAAKPQLGPLAACNRVAPLAPVKRNVRQAVRHFDPLDGRPAREAHHRP